MKQTEMLYLGAEVIVSYDILLKKYVPESHSMLIVADRRDKKYNFFYPLDASPFNIAFPEVLYTKPVLSTKYSKIHNKLYDIKYRGHECLIAFDSDFEITGNCRLNSLDGFIYNEPFHINARYNIPKEAADLEETACYAPVIFGHITSLYKKQRKFKVKYLDKVEIQIQGRYIVETEEIEKITCKVLIEPGKYFWTPLSLLTPYLFF